LAILLLLHYFNNKIGPLSTLKHFRGPVRIELKEYKIKCRLKKCRYFFLLVVVCCLRTHLFEFLIFTIFNNLKMHVFCFYFYFNDKDFYINMPNSSRTERFLHPAPAALGKECLTFFLLFFRSPFIKFVSIMSTLRYATL
jgi:hypothetical protein